MKQTIAATALLSGLAAAVPQWGGHGGPNNGGSWGAGGPFAAFPSCVSSCRDNNADYSNYQSLCTNTDTLNALNTCVDDSSCSDSEKSDVKEAIAQLCANAGATITAAPFASYSVTSGKWSTYTSPPGGAWGPGAWGQWASSAGVSGWPTNTAEWSSWASANGLPTATSAWSSWASANGWGPGRFGGGHGPWPTSAWSDFSSWTSAAGLTAAPTNTAEWDSITSAHPLPSDLSSAAGWWRANGFPGGSAWPTAWTTNSAWASAVSAWNGNGNGSGRPGWGGPGAGGFGPFGQHGGPGGNGWGMGPWASNGPWTSGAWTSWWGTNACPASTWSGWTGASWSTSAPWTTWSACTAQTTATDTVTVTTTDASGSSITSVSTSFGIRVAEATADSDGNAASSTNSDSGAMPTHRAVLGAAAGVFGVVAGALVL
ncbi:hypothetical protein AC579_9096 [Pseudocercospora musae]|uniref:Extracellular membrane protein CFEM domain-containing protein n=1 Tax=Pseudocercospora musae TaxID=113226 RepID=A0A139IIE3_9PEZI|nr:hypothetical protein AC579_9096 [Pseudocercospora musae]